MRFTEKFFLPSHRQADYDFINIRVDTDNLLFLDPTRFVLNDDIFSKECSKIVQDFFDTIFNLYLANKMSEARKNFSSSGESNEIFLGYTNGFPRGNGNSEESLTNVFNYVHNKGLLTKKVVGRIEDFHIFVPDFGEDLLSDLVASLIKKKLIEFTQEQCEKYGIIMDKKVKMNYWNHTRHSWYTIEAMLPQVNGYAIVLIPKNMAVSKFLYTPSNYWTQVISGWRQKYHKENDTKLHRDNVGRNGFVKKETIRELEGNGMTEKEYLIEQTIKDISRIVSFRRNIENTQRGSNNNQLSDEDLENYILASYDKIPRSIS